MRPYLVSVLAFSLISGCTVRFTTKVSDMQRSLDQFSAQTSKMVRSVDGARKQRQRILSDLKAQGADMASKPYPKLRQALRATADTRRVIQIKHRELKQLRKRFARLSRGKRKLYSDRPEWAKAKTIRNRLKPLHAELTALVKQAQNSFKTFDKTARKAKLGSMDVSQLASQIKTKINKLNQKLRSARSQVKKARSQLSSAATLTPNGRAIRTRALEEMTAAHKQIEDLVRALEKSTRQFEKVRAGRKKIVVGPGLLVHDLLPRMQKTAGKIKTEIAKMNAAAARFSKAPK